MPLDEFSREDRLKLLELKDFLGIRFNDRLDSLDSMHKFFCPEKDEIGSRLVSHCQITRNHTPVPVELQLRDFYRSRLAFVDRVLEDTREVVVWRERGEGAASIDREVR